MPLVTRLVNGPKEAEPVRRRIPIGDTLDGMDDEDAEVHVIRQPPMRVRAIWKSKNDWEDPPGKLEKPAFKTYELALPWSYFMIRMTKAGGLVTDTFLFVSDKRIEKKEDPIFMPPLPNIYPSGHICNGTIRILATDPPQKKAADLFAAFWSTPFTSETFPKDRLLFPRAFLGTKAILGRPWTFLDAWQYCDKNSLKIIWKPFRFRYRRKIYRIDTLKKAMEYALIFPDRNEVYSNR